MCAMLGPASADGDGGIITGQLTDAATGSPIRRITIRAFAHGRSVKSSCMSEGDGSFIMRNLPPGSYAVCVPAGKTFRALSVPEVHVKADQETRVDLKVRQSLIIDGDSWLQSYPAFCQSFKATGLGLTVAQLKAFGGHRQVTVQLLEGAGPDGQPIGPPRTTEPVGGEGKASVLWSGIEVPTTPGKTYTLKMTAPKGQTWTPGVAGHGDIYPLGSAWFDGAARPYSDLGILLCEDNDGMRTNYAMVGMCRDYRAVSAGQTFIALSKNIILASASLAGVGSAPSFVRFSIHKDGPGGEQIGPSKAVAPTRNATVAWGADEVPVTPGNTYYLHIETFNGGEFLINFNTDAYASGQAIFNGRPSANRDIAATVMGQISDDDFNRLVAHPKRINVIPLADTSFEYGDSGWQRQGDTGTVVGTDFGISPMWGSKMFGWTNVKKGEGSRTIIYQRVRVEPNEQYAFSGSVYTDHQGGRSSDVKIRLLVAPAGGTALRDNAQITTSQWYATEGQWRRGSVEFIATAKTITVGFDMEQRWSLDSCTLYVDGALLEQIGAE